MALRPGQPKGAGRVAATAPVRFPDLRGPISLCLCKSWINLGILPEPDPRTDHGPNLARRISMATTKPGAIPPAFIPERETRMTADYLQKQGPGRDGCTRLQPA